MTDDELIEFAWPDASAAERALFFLKLTPEKRATFERMSFVANELNAGRVPAGVMVDR